MKQLQLARVRGQVAQLAFNEALMRRLDAGIEIVEAQIAALEVFHRQIGVIVGHTELV